MIAKGSSTPQRENKEKMDTTDILDKEDEYDDSDEWADDDALDTEDESHETDIVIHTTTRS